MTIITIHSTLDLVYSSDDNDETGCGWYFDDFDNERASISYKTKAEALSAYKTDSIYWE